MEAFLSAGAQLGVGVDAVLASLLDASTQFVALADAFGTVVSVYRLPASADPSKFIGRPLCELSSRDSAPLVRACLAEVHRTHAPSGCEAAGTIEGYPERIGRIRVAPVFRSAAPTEKRVPPEPKQEIAGFIVLIADVSERRAQERALADREEKLRIAVDATQMGLWSFDVRSNHVVWDDRVSAIYGRDRPMTTFDEWRSALHPEDADRAIAVVERALRAGVFEPMEHRIIKPSGEVGF
jgi:PAS domain-containing protein